MMGLRTETRQMYSFYGLVKNDTYEIKVKSNMLKL